MKRAVFIASSLIVASTIGQAAASAEPPYDLPPYGVTVSRYDELNIDVAASVDVIDREAIAKSSAVDIVELLRSEANLYFRSFSANSAQSEVSIGGFGENSGQRVLVVLDGQRLNTADLGQLNWLSIPLSLVESIEVIKGGQAALYGNNAVGGVIKIETVRPTEELTGSVEASAGSFDTYNSRAGVTGRVGKFGYAVHAEVLDSDGYRENSEIDSRGAGFRLDADLTEVLSAYFSFNAVDSDYGLTGALTAAELAEDRRQSVKFDDEGEEEALYYRGGLKLELGNGLFFDVRGGFTDRSIETVFFDYTIPDMPMFPFNIEQDYEIFSVQPAIRYEANAVTAVVGIDYYDDTVEAVFGTDPVEYERETIGAYSSVKWELSENTFLTASGRIDNATTDGKYTVFGVPNSLGELDDDEYAWSVGLIRFIDNLGRVYASVRRFYRYPATDEVTVVDFFGATASFNPDLDPETGHEVEVGGEAALGRIVFGGRVFYQEMDDEIVFNPITFGNENLDETSRLGAELNARCDLNEYLAVAVDYTYIDAKIKDFEQVPLVPEHLARASLVVTPSDRLRFEFGATYTGSVFLAGDFDNEKSEIGGYTLFDLQGSFELCENVELFGAVQNLTDKEYLSTGISGSTVDGFYPGAGRAGRVGLRLRF